MKIKDEIKEYCKSIDIDCIGFSDINFNKEFIEILKQKRLSGNLSGFEESNEVTRTDIKAMLSDAKTLISIAVPYKTVEVDKTKPYFAKVALGKDYHIVVQSKLKQIQLFLKNKYAANSVINCDTGAICDREVAKKCGIGFYGKNNNIINKGFGSYIFLGDLITNIEIEVDKEIQSKCGNCSICIDSCPWGAIETPFVINPLKCISFITQKKGILSDEEMDKMGLRIYGCDTCQDVCPYNKRAEHSNLIDFVPQEFSVNIDYECILNMTNSEFKKTFGYTSCGWRGKKIIQRNIIITLGNTRDNKYTNILKKILGKNKELDYYILRSIKKLEEI